jgi:hypothetical protein
MIQSPAEYCCPSIIMVSFVWNMFIFLITCVRRSWKGNMERSKGG